MTKLYDAYTNQPIKTFHTVAGFAIRQGDVLNVDGIKYKIKTIEHILETKGEMVIYTERKVFVTHNCINVVH